MVSLICFAALAHTQSRVGIGAQQDGVGAALKQIAARIVTSLVQTDG
jgi:hypothetical protein